MRRAVVHVLSLALVASAGCGSSSSSSGSSSAPSASEVATSAVSGALNNSGGSPLGWNGMPRPTAPLLRRLIDELSPLRSAHAASWTCSGGSLVRSGTSTPGYTGPGTYTFTPVSCAVTWANGRTASSQWSGPFTLDYGATCDASHARIVNQTGSGCAQTRTTASGGATRTITGPNGNAYAITHDTNGAGTGWDASVSPAPTSDGVIVTCATGGCATGGGTLEISGSHLSGTVTPSGGSATTVWDHTVSTATPLAFTAQRVLSGTITVQHNLAKYTATATFDGVGFGEPGCCYPTAGTVTTTFASGPSKGKTETLAFGSTCGEATLTPAGGAAQPLTLQHCL